MRQIRIGEVTIDAVVEREGPWRRPQDFFPSYDEATFQRHLPGMEPEVFDVARGMMNITYQTFVVRSPRHTILVDTCTGEDKGHAAPFDFPGKERWRNELFALGVSYDKIDYVFCTHLHIDHTGWNTTLRDGRWVPTFPNAKYIFHKREYAAWEDSTRSDVLDRPAGDRPRGRRRRRSRRARALVRPALGADHRPMRRSGHRTGTHPCPIGRPVEHARVRIVPREMGARC